ncbi:MAG: thermonuclease family protein [Acidimicrobiia bacterium]
MVDGDSLRVDIDGQTVEIRLGGINAPEFDECHAAPAADRLRRLLGESVWLDVISTDQYGRSVGYVWVDSDSDFVNGSLVADGHALAMTTDDRWAALLIGAEEAARERDDGLWSPDACGEDFEFDLALDMTQPDPPGPDNEVLDEEFVTIHNDGDQSADLTGFVLRDESTVNRLRLPAGTVVPAGGARVIPSGCDDPIGWCSSMAIWNNAGDSALLLGPEGTVVAHTRYRPSD